MTTGGVDGTPPSRQTMLVAEIGFAQANIGRYDTNGIAIKRWAVISWVAGIAAGIEQADYRYPLLGGLVVVAFALLELVYRRFQCRFIRRARDLEILANSEDISTYMYSFHEAAYDDQGWSDTRAALAMQHFIPTYVFLVAVAVVIAAIV